MQYDLVFEGGGAKGMVFAGAGAEFFHRKHTFNRLLGTSAGAITATLLAAGYTPEEMAEALTEKEDGRSVFEGFMGIPGPSLTRSCRRGRSAASSKRSTSSSSRVSRRGRSTSSSRGRWPRARRLATCSP